MQAAPPRCVSVSTPDTRYDILIGSGLIGQAATWDGLPAAHHGVIVSNPTVHALHGPALAAALAP